jgi:hypothetical protein
MHMRAPLGLLFGAVLMAVTACATGPTTPPSVNVTGQWAGTWAYENASVGSGDIRGTFQQDGANVSGNFTISGPNVQNRVATVTGTISGNEIKLSMPASGYLTVTGNQMAGSVNGLNVAKLTLRKQ